MRILKSSIAIIAALTGLFGLGLLVMFQPVQAATTATLQALINGAPAGGTIVLPVHTFHESLTVNKSLTLTGVASNTTIIEAVTGQRVITVTAGNNLRLENLTVIGGQTSDVGGGVYVMSGSLTIVNSRIMSNAAAYGGGIFQAGSNGRVDVIDSQIEFNTSSNHGGGLYVNDNAALTNTLLISNTATWHGGGLHGQSGRVDVSGGMFEHNRALNGNGGAVNVNGSISLNGVLIVSNTAVNGGGLLQWNTSPTVIMTNTQFERNLATGMGGGAFISGTSVINHSFFVSNTVDSGSSGDTFGGGLYIGAASQIFASTFSGNSALCLNGGSCASADGGGLHDNGGNAALTNVVFQSNRAGRMGGGMNSEYSSPVLSNVIFRGNTAGWGGGLNHSMGSPLLINVLFSGNEAGWAGGMLADHDTPTLKHVTFSGNDGYNQGGALLNYYAAPIVLNSILWGNTAMNGPEIYNAAPSPVITVTYSDVKFTGVYTGVGNLNADPRFVLPIGYAAAPTTTGDYHLQSGSPAIDHGTAAGVMIDLDGRPRPIGLGYDLGAYESPLSVYLPLILR